MAAISNNPFILDPFRNGFDNLDVKEYSIGGKLIVAKINAADMFELDPDSIKSRLVSNLSEYILHNNFVEFTKIPNVHDGSTTYIARCYLAPNDQVKILRSLK